MATAKIERVQLGHLEGWFFRQLHELSDQALEADCYAKQDLVRVHLEHDKAGLRLVNEAENARDLMGLSEVEAAFSIGLALGSDPLGIIGLIATYNEEDES